MSRVILEKEENKNRDGRKNTFWLCGTQARMLPNAQVQVFLVNDSSRESSGTAST